MRTLLRSAVLLAALLAACGGGSAGDPADCGDLGPVTELRDPAGGFAASPRATSKGRVPIPDAPGRDLRAAAVAAGRGQVCARFELGDAVEPPVVLKVALRRPDVDRLVALSVLVVEDGKPRLAVEPGPDGPAPIPGRAVVDGDVVTLVLDRAALAPSLRTVLDAEFEWQAQTLFGERSGGMQVQFRDCGPDPAAYARPVSVRHPSGRRTVGRTGGCI